MRNLIRCAKMNTSAVHVASQFPNESEINSRGLNISIAKCITYSLVGSNTTNSSFDLLICYLFFFRIYFWRNYFRNDAIASRITIQLKLKSVEHFSSGRNFNIRGGEKLWMMNSRSQDIYWCWKCCVSLNRILLTICSGCEVRRRFHPIDSPLHSIIIFLNVLYICGNSLPFSVSWNVGKNQLIIRRKKSYCLRDSCILIRVFKIYYFFSIPK